MSKPKHGDVEGCVWGFKIYVKDDWENISWNIHSGEEYTFICDKIEIIPKGMNSKEIADYIQHKRAAFKINELDK